MNGGLQPALFFLSAPDLKSLCYVTLSLQNNYEEPRSKQIKTCRELVLLFSDVLASPALDSFMEITAVMTIPFFQRGVLQGFVHRHCLQMGSPEQVFPGTLQCCLSFSLIARLSPNWNKAGPYLVYGKDFLSARGRLSAVSLELSSSEGQLCLSLQPNTIRLHPTALEDFELPPLVLNRFCSDLDCVLEPQSTGGPIWCHVLPSLKKGQIITISRRLPKDGPFKSYRELQSHWNTLYGYRLPDLEENEVVYCSVFFKPVGQKLFTYPLSCIRLSPVQCCPRVDVQGTLSCFMSDVRDRLPSVCGFPTRISAKASFPTTGFNPASTQIWSRDYSNLSAFSSSRPVLTQLPPPPPSFTRPMKSFFGSQPASVPPLSSFSGSFTSQPSSSFSSNSTPTFSDLFKPASSLNTFFTVFESQSSSSPPPPHPPPEEKPKLVPIFRNKQPSRHVNVALLKAEKQKQNIERITLPTFSNAQTSVQVPRFLPIFPTAAQSSSNVRRIPTFSPKNRARTALVLLTAEVKEGKEKKKKKKSKPVVKFNLEETEKTAPREKAKTTNGGSKKGEEKSRSTRAKKEVDVEKMARNNQLSKVSSVKMLLWLRDRGLTVGHKLPKDQLMLKVMGCLTEA